MKKLFRILKRIVDKINDINNKYDIIVSKKPYKYVLQFLPHNIFLIVLFVILLVIFTPKVLGNTVLKYQSKDFSEVYSEIYDKSIEQKIDTSNIKELDNLNIYLLTYDRKNDSVYKLDVLKDGKVVFSQRFNAKTVKNYQYNKFKVNISKIDKKSKYKYVLTPVDVDEGRGITCVLDSNGNFVYSILNKSEFYYEVIIGSIIFLFIFLMFNYLINNNIIRTERKFLLLTLIYIIPVLFIYPTYEIPDEPFHFRKSLSLSQYDFTKNVYQNMMEKKLFLPKNYKCLESSGPLIFDNVINKKEYLNCIKSEKTIKTDLSGTETTRLFSAIPGAIGIKIVDIFSNSPMVIFYAGRLFNFLVAFLIIIFAFKIIPDKYKKLLLMIVLIPMLIQQMVSYSYDAMLNAFCLLLIAYLIKFYEEKSIAMKDLIIYSFVSLIVLDIKIPYLILSLPIIFINKEKFGTEKFSKIKKLLMVFLILLVGYFGFKYLSTMGVPTVSAKDATGINSISSVLFHPRYLLSLIYHTLQHYGISYIESLIGKFAWYSKHFNLLLLYSYLLFLVLVALSENSKIGARDKIINILLDMMLIASVFLAMYIYWTPVGSKIIEGVQGRYFLPALALLLFMIIPKKKLVKLENKTIYSFINITLLFYVITLLFEFY